MYEKLREYIEESNNIVFFGGAGEKLEMASKVYLLL